MVEILGIASPLLDYILHVSETFLNKVTDLKGGMEPIDHDNFFALIRSSHSTPKITAGGSGTNTIKGLAKLGNACSLAGKIGEDPPSEQVLESIASYRITPHYKSCKTPTGKVICLVTPDGERTMRSFLGASLLFGPKDLKPKIFNNKSLVHIEGYTILNPEITEYSMSLAKKAGAKVSYDLGNFEVVYKKKEVLLPLIKSYVDVLFANENELFALTGLPAEEGCKKLREFCKCVVILRGKKGCLIGTRSSLITHPAYVVEHPLDTTGAGDLFASGFLHGYFSNKNLHECARLGALIASRVVQVNGAEIPLDLWKNILVQL